VGAETLEQDTGDRLRGRQPESSLSSSLTLRGPVAYLTGEYPKVSHTFIQREVAALRGLGVNVITCTVRHAPAKDVVGADQKIEEANTFCIMDAARNPFRLVKAHLVLLVRSPGRWFSALGLAWRTRSPGAKAALYQLFYFAEAGILAEHLKRCHVQHLHNHFGNSSCSVAMLTSALSGIPFSFTEHGPALFFEPVRWRIDEKIARASSVIAISHFCRSQLMLFSDPSHWSKISIVHCGIDPEKYGHDRTPFRKRILFIGRLDHVKGEHLLIDAFAEVRRVHGDATLTVVGDGPSRRGLEARAASLGLDAASVTFTGYLTQDEVALSLDEADVLVLPSFAEGVPVVLMEAMAAGKPTIASRLAGIPELVDDGKTGYLISPGATDELCTRLVELLSDPDRCQRMGEAGRQRVQREFNVRHEAARLAHALLGPTSKGPS
jgi:glycosyltransferase involved in cell wall biosynthesis